MSEPISTLLKQATEKLSSGDSPRLDAEILLCNLLNKDRSYLYAHGDDILPSNLVNRYLDQIQKRANGVPVAYLIGKKEFWSLDFHVTSDTLIPRPETELLVTTTLNHIDNNKPVKIIDLGTGSGAIAIALAKELPQASITATDKSPRALEIAKLNAKRLNVNNVTFILSDWFSAIEETVLDVIISNPPYISESDPHLDKEDIKFEPQSALVSGVQGLNDLEQIIKQSKNYLRDSGLLLVEHGYKQGEAVKELMQYENYQSIQAVYDISGHHRATMAMKK